MEDEQNNRGLPSMSTSDQLGFLESILASSTDCAIIALDLEGTILAWNTGAKLIHGYDASDVIGKNASILFVPDDIQSGKFRLIQEETLRSGIWTHEIRLTRKDGSEFNALATITVRKNNRNTPVGLTALSRDLSNIESTLNLLQKIRTSEEQLYAKNQEIEEACLKAEESSRLKSEFLANVSHELRTPLNGIIGFAELLHDDLVDPKSPKYKEFLNDIISNAKHLLTLISDVLDLSKIEAGKMEFRPQKTNLNAVLKQISTMFQKMIAEKNIRFEIKIDPAVSTVVIDPTRLTQILLNYLSNAFKFTPKGGEVTVLIYPVSKKNFRIDIHDTGIGIRKEDLDKLFVKFQQLDSSTTKSYQGTGLGLALTKQLVEAQGGRVGVKSVIGKGSTFHAILPCFPHHITHIDHLEEEVPTTPTIKLPSILVIEPESQDRNLMIDTLTQAGYSISVDTNMSAALQNHPKKKFDAIIIDLFQPDMGNWKILRCLRTASYSQDVPPVVIKAMLEYPITVGSIIYDFLVKPVKPQALLDTLESMKPNHAIKTILIVDHDEQAVSLVKPALIKAGYHVICKDNKVGAILALEQEYPEVVIFDPFMFGIDGFEFMRYYRQTERGAFTPMIIWSNTKLSLETRIHLKASIQRIVLIGEGLTNDLFKELKQHLSPTNN